MRRRRVHGRGERFGAAQALPPPVRDAPTVGTLIELLRRLPEPDPDFADDLEETQAGQLPPRDPWAS